MNDQLHFEVTINAPVTKVWKVMLSDESYRQWTTAFDTTSYFEGSWGKGSKIKFLGEGGGGMLSEIAENIPHKFISIKHLGILVNGIEDTSSVEAQKWAGGFENYTFHDNGAETHLEIDIIIEFTPETQLVKEEFKVMWPKALLKLKELCEA